MTTGIIFYILAMLGSLMFNYVLHEPNKRIEKSENNK